MTQSQGAESVFPQKRALGTPGGRPGRRRPLCGMLPGVALRPGRDVIPRRRGRGARDAISGRPAGGALGVGRLQGRGWRRPPLQRLRDEREEPEERREMGG